MEYPKINSLWKREGWYFDQTKKKSSDFQEGRQSFIIGDYAREEFPAIRNWWVDEKIDGTNIRIQFKNSINFKGKTDNAQIPCRLLEELQKIFTFEKMARQFPLLKDGSYQDVMLFGEGYGEKIQKCGGNYRKGVGFMLFDAWINGWWLERNQLSLLANELGIECPPSFGLQTIEQIIQLVKNPPDSLCSRTPHAIEGVVCRSQPLMLFRQPHRDSDSYLAHPYHYPVMWKLKCRDFDVRQRS